MRLKNARSDGGPPVAPRSISSAPCLCVPDVFERLRCLGALNPDSVVAWQNVRRLQLLDYLARASSTPSLPTVIDFATSEAA